MARPDRSTAPGATSEQDDHPQGRPGLDAPKGDRYQEPFTPEPAPHAPPKRMCCVNGPVWDHLHTKFVELGDEPCRQAGPASSAQLGSWCARPRGPASLVNTPAIPTQALGIGESRHVPVAPAWKNSRLSLQMFSVAFGASSSAGSRIRETAQPHRRASAIAPRRRGCRAARTAFASGPRDRLGGPHSAA